LIVANSPLPEQIAALAASIKKSDPMFFVPDMRLTIQWYQSIGFKVVDQYEDAGELLFARLAFGTCEFGLSPGAESGPRDVRLWLYTDRVEELHEVLKLRQHDEPKIRFDEELYAPFYGGRQFSIRDNNGLILIFWQPDWLAKASHQT
jgi:catechol 2,3-dioxygenase-like lactoylglutathione lyase family enzyme